jgi:hypothetical protein
MAKRRTLEPTPEQYTYLVKMRDHDKRPYLRERAAALLKVASGDSPHHVARHGLLRPRDPDSVYRWLDDFIRNGCLTPRPPCRGPFSPEGSAARGSGRSPEPAGRPRRP